MNEKTRIIETGRMAQLLKASIVDHVFDVENDLITRLIAEYRNGALTDTRLRGAIGEIAGMRSLIQHLEADIRKGMKETTEVMEKSDA